MIQTRSQRLAQTAFEQISSRPLTDNYKTFAKKFPALVHTCGLAQAVAFARAKNEQDYLFDLALVLTTAGHTQISDPQTLDNCARTVPVSEYLRLSRDTIEAASWLKRYVEVVSEDTQP